MNNIIDFQAKKEEKETLAKIKASNVTASGIFDTAMGNPIQALDDLMNKTFSLRTVKKETQDD